MTLSNDYETEEFRQSLKLSFRSVATCVKFFDKLK